MSTALESGARIAGERSVTADACVIGTGAGGAPVAALLAEAGLRVAILEARALMLRELAGLAAERRSATQAERLNELAGRFAATEDPHDAARVDFAFFTEVAQAAGNLVFELILNAIRELYFAHLDAVPVTARPAELAPIYARIARAIDRGDGNRARAAAFELATRQTEQVGG